MTVEGIVKRFEAYLKYRWSEDTEKLGYDEYAQALREALDLLKTHPEAQIDPGEVSDGYHTFNELYHHRAVLFSVICNEHPDLAWKSKHHHVGGEPMYDGMFIVGIETPNGQATYHYNLAYWDMFEVRELENAPEWDGHTPAQAIERIGKLSKNEPLTLEELREMDSQPVWVELGPGYEGRWALVQVWAKSTNIIYLIQANGSVLHLKAEIDNGAKLYRHPPKED